MSDLLNQTCCECGQSGEALYCVPCVSKSETKRLQDLVATTFKMEAEIERLQEQLTKMSNEWVEITRGEIEEAFAMADNLTDFGFLVEAKCKAKNGYI
jgi:uncharacterized membrane protein YukC